MNWARVGTTVEARFRVVVSLATERAVFGVMRLAGQVRFFLFFKVVVAIQSPLKVEHVDSKLKRSKRAVFQLPAKLKKWACRIHLVLADGGGGFVTSPVCASTRNDPCFPNTE